MAENKELEGAATTIGMVPGPYQPEYLVCQRMGHMISSQGIWFSDPFDSAFPILMLQIILIIFTTRILLFFLKPLRMNLLLGYILVVSLPDIR